MWNLRRSQNILKSSTIIIVKQTQDPRHLQRIARMRAMFARSFSDASWEDSPELAEISKHLPQIDAHIAAGAPQWPLHQINKVDLAILRISVFELMQRVTPPKVVIDEAIEIAKEYGAERSAQFVNGVLATVLKNFT